MIRKFLSNIEGLDLYDLALRLTLINLILRPVGSVELRIPVLIVSIFALLVPKILKNPNIWFLLTGLTATRVIADWPLPDNHAYLLSIWCFAVFISVLRNDRSMLAVNAKLIVGLVFTFAFIWKALLSADYIDGRFFSFSLIEDCRFSEFTQLACSIGAEDIYDYRDYITQHVDGQLLYTSPTDINLGCINKVSGFLTYYTLFIELLLALFFLIPNRFDSSKYRDYVLILFCMSIYSVATVEGFGWLLIAMGVSQSENRNYKVPLYLLSFIIILCYREISISQLILNIL